MDQWEGPTYADYIPEEEGPPTVNLGLTYDPSPIWRPQPVQIPAVIAWGVAVVALFVVLNRSF